MFQIANINNCKTFSDLTVKIQTKYLTDASGNVNVNPERVKKVANEFHMFAQEL